MQRDEAMLNELETAVLQRMADNWPALRSAIPELGVIRREFTGAGSYTYFVPHRVVASASIENPLSLDAVISLPDIHDGLGAWLWFEESSIACLEIFVCGDADWSGECTGFSLADMRLSSSRLAGPT